MKLTKTQLREEQNRLAQLEKYVPTLQLKKAMLQQEVIETVISKQKKESEIQLVDNLFEESACLLSDDRALLLNTLEVVSLKTHLENIAGVEVPVFEGIEFSKLNYMLTDTPAWFDIILDKLKQKATLNAQLDVLDRRKKLLEKEFKEVSIRLNLFEKVLIPRAKENIKKIKIYLGDQQLSAVCQSKMAKKKIIERAMESI
jgi:V/A-type H+/Na+-transporting ATPase subunit D